MISVRLNLEVARELERFQGGSLLSKNMIINRGTRLYIQLLRMMPDIGEDMREVMENPRFWELMKEVIANKSVYWRL